MQARSLLPVRASCFWIAFSTAGLLLDCFQLRSLAFGLLSALPACFWIAFSTCGLDWIWIVSLIGNLRKDCSRKLEVFPLRTEPRGHVFLAVHMQATRLCTITPQQSWPPRIVAPRQNFTKLTSLYVSDVSWVPVRILDQSGHLQQRHCLR